MSQANSSFGWQRSVIGWLAVSLLVAAALTWLVLPVSASSRTFLAICIRMGLLLGALWLALPQLAAIWAKYPRWMWGLLVFAAILIFLQPASLAYLVPIGVVVWLLYRGGVLKQIAQRFFRRGQPEQKFRS
ncbi:MAG: hypothetical protein KatS3mg110_4081 [Pirellulaceae bacterium]|nr:MAG: hypothetical protein KatS3mg110_4081 [Pirellulaceae bacterium]